MAESAPVGHFGPQGQKPLPDGIPWSLLLKRADGNNSLASNRGTEGASILSAAMMRSLGLQGILAF
jgi:hypothetical protein